MTVKEYLRDDALSGMALVTELVHGEKPMLRLSKTWFHAQGGGQKADRGEIGGRNVIHVAHSDGYVDHHMDSIAGLVVGKEYGFRIDQQWRQRNSVHHTAGHLIAGVVEAEFPALKAVAGHQWPGEARVEFDAATVGLVLDHFTLILREKLAACIRANLPVVVLGDPFTSRSIQIGSCPAIPCGGTHVKSLGEIREINVTGVRRKSGKLRVSYEAFAYEYLG
jgi:alanyl-tRNA synthetase